MDMKRVAVGTIVGGIVLYIVGYLIFDVAVADFYAANRGSATGAFRDTPIVWAVVLADFALALLVTLCIAGRAASQTIGGGFITGGVIGFLVWFHADFTSYGYLNVWNMPIPIVDPLLEIIHEGVAGAAIAALLMRIPAAAKVQPAG